MTQVCDHADAPQWVDCVAAHGNAIPYVEVLAAPSFEALVMAAQFTVYVGRYTVVAAEEVLVPLTP